MTTETVVAEVSQDTPVDSEQEAPPIQEVVEAETPPEAEAEAGAEQPETPEPDIIESLSDEVVEEVVRRRGDKSPYVQELVRRREQAAADKLAAEQAQRATAQEDANRIMEAGRKAIAEIDAVMVEASRDDGTGQLDKGRLLNAINTYRDAWVMGQAQTWNRELQEGFLSQGDLVGALAEADMERLGTALKASNRQNTRTPLVKEMFALAREKALQQGYALAVQDLEQYGKRQDAVEAQKEGLKKLKSAVPPPAPAGSPAPSSSDEERLDRLAEGTATPADKQWYQTRYGKYAG
jgi:hypothetical protein